MLGRQIWLVEKMQETLQWNVSLLSTIKFCIDSKRLCLSVSLCLSLYLCLCLSLFLCCFYLVFNPKEPLVVMGIVFI